MSFSEKDIFYMQLALDEARAAAQSGEIPVGAVLVDTHSERILATGRNTRETERSALGHAEINAIADGCAALGSWRLSDCTLYITLEPCPMCSGAILNARIPRVVCGAMDPVAGAMGSVWALHEHPIKSNHVHLESGCLEQECKEVLTEFFKNKR